MSNRLLKGHAGEQGGNVHGGCWHSRVGRRLETGHTHATEHTHGHRVEPLRHGSVALRHPRHIRLHLRARRLREELCCLRLRLEGHARARSAVLLLLLLRLFLLLRTRVLRLRESVGRLRPLHIDPLSVKQVRCLESSFNTLRRGEADKAKSSAPRRGTIIMTTASFTSPKASKCCFSA